MSAVSGSSKVEVEIRGDHSTKEGDHAGFIIKACTAELKPTLAEMPLAGVAATSSASAAEKQKPASKSAG